MVKCQQCVLRSTEWSSLQNNSYDKNLTKTILQYSEIIFNYPGATTPLQSSSRVKISRERRSDANKYEQSRNSHLGSGLSKNVTTRTKVRMSWRERHKALRGTPTRPYKVSTFGTEGDVLNQWLYFKGNVVARNLCLYSLLEEATQAC